MIARIIFILILGTPLVLLGNEATDRIGNAKAVFQEIMSAPDRGIPRDLLDKAHCIVIVPAVKRAGFIVGGQYGKGVATCRSPQGTGWTEVSTVNEKPMRS